MVILNDGLSAIERNPEEFVKNLTAAIMQVMRGSPVDVPCDSHANVAQVVETHHADDTVVVATGGNHGTKLGYVLGYHHHRPEDKLRIVKELAKDLGYNLSKKRTQNVRG